MGCVPVTHNKEALQKYSYLYKVLVQRTSTESFVYHQNISSYFGWGGEAEVLEKDDFEEAETFACIGRRMVCNPQGVQGKEASPARENRRTLHAGGGHGWQGPAPSPPNLVLHCLMGKASAFWPANTGRPLPSPPK